MASFIANLEPRLVEVPQSIIATLDRVIRFRSEFSGFLRQGNESRYEKNEKDNEGHAYFIETLKRVKDILTPSIASLSVDDGISPDILVNRFQTLELHEPSDDFLKAPGMHVPASKPSTGDELEAQQMLVYFGLLKELESLRSEVKRRWEGYRDGTCDLAVASMAADAAVSLARSLEDDIPKQLQHSDASAWLALNSSRSHNKPDTAGAETSEASDLIMIVACYKLHTLHVSICAETSSRNGENAASGFSPHPVSEYSSRVAKMEAPPLCRHKNRAVRRWWDMLRGYLLVFAGSKRYPCTQSGMVTALEPFVATGKVPFSTVFAAQIYLDMLLILGDHAPQAFYQVKDYISRFEEDCKLTYEQATNLEWLGASTALTQRQYLNLGEDPGEMMMGFLNVDNDNTICRMFVGKPIHEEMKEPFCYRKWNPWFCGLSLHKLRMCSAGVGMNVLLPINEPQQLIHLINMVESETLQKKVWIDLDVVKSLYQPQYNFVDGTPPTLSGDYSKHIREKVCRLRLKHFTPYVFLPVPPGTRKPAWFDNIFAKVFVSLIFAGDKVPSAMDLTGENLSTILGVRRGTCKLPKSKAKPQSHGYNYAAIDIVRALADTLEDEVDMMTFSYLQFHRHIMSLTMELGFFKDIGTPFGDVEGLPGCTQHKTSFWDILLLMEKLCSNLSEPEIKQSLLTRVSFCIDEFLKKMGGNSCHRGKQHLVDWSAVNPGHVESTGAFLCSQQSPGCDPSGEYGDANASPRGSSMTRLGQ